jgi:RimJ/RimL family protein N-acetyltransferase
MAFELHTERLVLRPPVQEDAESLFRLMHEQVDTTFLSWESHQNIETTIGLIQNLQEAQKNDRGYHWCVCLDEEIIGLVSLIDVRRKMRTWTLNRAELSYWIGKRYLRRGYATEAAKRLVSFGFDDMALHKIIIAHADENVESQRICEKLAFTKYALEHDAFMKDGKWYNLIWYHLFNKPL